MVVVKLINNFKKILEGWRVTIGQKSVFENVAEEQWDTGILGYFGNRFGIKLQGLVTAQPGVHKLSPAITGEVAGEKLTFSAQLLAFCVHVIHELVNEGDGNLLDL